MRHSLDDSTEHLREGLRLSLVDAKIERIRRDAAEIGSQIGTIAELRKLSQFNTPIADLRMSARALRLAALKLDEIASKAMV